MRHVTTIGGVSGSLGYADGTFGLSGSTFYAPYGIAMDSAGTVQIVADTNNCLIRLIQRTLRTVTTLAGNANPSICPASRPYSDGVGSDASLFYPRGIAMDSAGSSALIVDSSNCLIRHINVSSGRVTTIAGNYPSCSAVDGTSCW